MKCFPPHLRGHSCVKDDPLPPVIPLGYLPCSTPVDYLDYNYEIFFSHLFIINTKRLIRMQSYNGKQ